MAYNPFTWFRKNQKALFAVLTIIIMFVFTASFGAGDVMHYINFWFATGRSSGPEVTPLGNRTVYASDVERVANQRELANRFLLMQLQSEQQAATDKLLNQLQKLDEGSPLLGLRMVLDELLIVQRGMQNLQRMAMMGQLNQQLLLFQRNQMLETLFRLMRDPSTGLPAVAAREGVKENREYLELVMQAGALLGIETWMLARSSADAFLLGGDRSPESTLDFLLWQQQADRLGITLTDEDLAKQINRDLGGVEIFEPGTAMNKNKRVLQFIGGNQNREVLKPSELIDALREEYRVAMAQSLLLGFEPGIRVWRSVLHGGANPTTGTPDEFLHFVRSYRTTLRVQVMPVSVEPFVSKITQQPTQVELERLFTRYREQEPDPARRTPGFKLPRRVRAQYVIGSVQTPAFRDDGQTWAIYLLELSEPYRRAKMILLSGCLSPLGAGPLGPTLALLQPLLNDPVQQEYRQYLSSTEAWITSDDLLSRDLEKR
ncbi:MAG: hypothetical protein SNJ75_17175, partial [Gemmataceae bacterium]